MYVPESARLANNYSYENLNAEFFHPTFLYEIIPNFLLFILILWFYDILTDKRSGMVFVVYAVGYGLIRFVTEFFRLDALAINLPQWLQLSPFAGLVIDRLLVSQLLALGLLILGIFVWFKRRNVLFLSRSMKEVKT
jgi:phosphatidylglycerol:prolipoprotein diacylglycerol transferase